jgi:prevent-host-death family protein
MNDTICQTYLERDLRELSQVESHSVDKLLVKLYINNVHFGGFMRRVNITDLRKHLPAYLGQVQSGEELTVTSHGKAIARIIPNSDVREESRRKLKELRGKTVIGDVISPIGIPWKAEE